MVSKRWLRKMGAWALCGSLGASGLWLAAQATGQGPEPIAPQQAPQAQKKKIYTNKNVFHLPVQIDPKTRGSLREVCLYVKVGQSDWVRQDTKDPSITHFTYRATQDGEHWFSVVTVDFAGRSTPADVSREAPGLQVVVDTREPVLDMQPVVTTDGETLLRCTMDDAHPDERTLKLVYRGSDLVDHVIDALPNRPGVFRVPQEAWTRPVLVKGTDRCGNPAVREFQLRPTQAANPAAAQVQMRPEPGRIEPVQSVEYKPGPPPGVRPSTAPESVASGRPHEVVRIVDSGKTPEPPKEQVAHSPNRTEAPSPFPPGGITPAGPVGPDITGSKIFGHGNTSGPRQLLNTTKASVEYRIDQVGPSGVGKIEVYMTADNGASWSRIHEDIDRRTPAEINLPGEGVFGIRMVVTNGNGFGGAAPAKGEAPTSFIEVDTTTPDVQLRDIEPNTKNGCLEIRWKATDKNLGAEPVNLFYRIRSDAAWIPMVKKIRNEGLYLWSFPRDSGNRFYVKIEVADQAGNLARVECANPVVLDMTEPRASVVGITAMQTRTAQE